MASVEIPGTPGSELAGLFDLATASDARSLHRLATAAEQSVLGCSAANVATWHIGEPQLVASTHPDLPGLIDVEVRSGRGPVLAAIAQAAVPVSCPDTLIEARWPEYAQAALTAGVRCSLTFAHLSGSDAVSLTLFGARPQVHRSAPGPGDADARRAWRRRARRGVGLQRRPQDGESVAGRR